MKKLTLLIFALFLAISVSTQAQEKKTFEGAVAAAGLTVQETVKVTAINQEKLDAIKVIKKQKLGKEVENKKLKEAKQASTNKIKALIGKDKFKAMNAYWKKK
jgi:ABC-type uncharacterized transport system YnjBCD substrate-binding protein